MGSMPVRGGLALLMALVMALTGGQLILPRMVEDQLAAGIRDSVGPVGLVHVDVSAFPAWHLLGGKVRQMTVDVRQAHIGGLKIEAFLIDAHNLLIDMPKLRRGEGFTVRAADSLRVSAVISEGDLNAYLWAEVDPSRRFQIRLTPEVSYLEGSIKVLGKAIGVKVRGRFEVADRTLARFVVDDVEIQNARLPRFIVDALLPKWAVQIDLANSPVPLEVRDLRVEDGRLFIYGQRPDDLPQTGTDDSKPS